MAFSRRTFAASADGTVAVGINTGAGFGYITIEEIGLTSGKDTGGVVQVAPTGPYLPGVTGAPHAINTTASGHFYLYGWGYPVSSTLTLYRNGVLSGNRYDKRRRKVLYHFHSGE